jgi:hypothetical protein
VASALSTQSMQISTQWLAHLPSAFIIRPHQ